MKVILRADVASVGKRGDIIDVADGFARNYLLPKSLAMKATAGASIQASSMRRARDLKDVQDKTAAGEVARVLVARTITISARASDGRLYGSVGAAEIAEAVAEQAGAQIDRKHIMLGEPIKDVGTHSVVVKLHSEIEFPITVEVVAG